jgi:FKBP-type peptidyl-prolyl cis-trans isomerase
MIKKICVVLFFILVNLRCFGLEISSQEAYVLEEFFRVMLGSSEGGFVLYDKKPLCINGFYFEDDFVKEIENHRTSVYLREGAFILKKMSNKLKNKIIIHIYNRPDTLAKDYVHILFINRDLFLSVVKNNLSLFQYVLGPSVTPMALLNQLTDSNNSFHSILKNDKVLIGILLGYGTQNSLYVSRIENIEEELLAPDQPPFKSLLSRLEVLRPEHKELLLFRRSPSCTKYPEQQPGFGHATLNEEIKDLGKKIDISSLKLAQQSPPFMFGRLKEDKETDKLVKDLEDTQIKINDLVSSKNFLNDVLKIVLPDVELTINNKVLQEEFFSQEELEQLPLLVAANIWKIIEEENESYKKSFIRGMYDADNSLEPKVQLLDTLGFEKMKILIKAKQNIKVAEDFFKKLNSEKSFICVFPFKLYYKVMKKGNGSILDDRTNVTVHYNIKTPDDTILIDTWLRGLPMKLNLLETFPGFAKGVKGMRIGEMREIFIHPSLAYGLYTTLEKGIYLKATVQLLDVGQETEEKNDSSEIIILDLENELNKNIESDYSQQSKKIGYAVGYELWLHYKKNEFYKFSQILKWLKLFESGENVDITSEGFQILINRLHWNIYHS